MAERIAIEMERPLFNAPARKSRIVELPTIEPLRKSVFTTRYLRSLVPSARGYELTEPGRKGLRIRVSPTGIKSWHFVYRRAGKLHRITFGQFPAMGLKEAHNELAKARARLGFWD